MPFAIIESDFVMLAYDTVPYLVYFTIYAMGYCMMMMMMMMLLWPVGYCNNNNNNRGNYYYLLLSQL